MRVLVLKDVPFLWRLLHDCGVFAGVYSAGDLPDLL